MSSATGVAQHEERLAHLERNLMRIRWFGVALGLSQVASAYRVGMGELLVPGYARPAGYALFAVFGLANLGIMRALRGQPDRRRLAAVGRFAFSADVAVVAGVTWLFSFDPDVYAWVTQMIVCLEGAARARFAGAMTSVAGLAVLEIFRDAYRRSAFDVPVDAAYYAFRIGMMAIVGAVAGVMAVQLERGRIEAEARARELEAFHEIVLAGAAGRTFRETVERIVSSMARLLGYETFAVGVVEDDPAGPVVRCVAAAGLGASMVDRSVRVDEGVVGRAVASGQPQLVADTRADPDYVEFVSEARCEMTVPIVVADRVIGVVDVESRVPGRYTPADLDRLSRLAPQIGLIMTNARLLARERRAVERIGVISHEMRNPLQAVAGFVETLRRPGYHPRRRELDLHYEVMQRQTRRLIRLVEDLLVTSSIGSGTFAVRYERVETQAVVRDVTEDLGEGRDRVSVRNEVSGLRLVTDEQRLAQALRNLVENAIRYAPSPSPVTLAARSDAGDVVFEVADQGPGIEPDLLERVFEPFWRNEHAEARTSGAGLGLYIARTLVETLGGSIVVRSEPGRGSSFEVRLPAEPPAASRSAS